jgi:hypothetical protein
VIDAVLPLKVEQEEESYDPIYSPVLEMKLDKNGYWRLSTTDYLVHHMGNSVPDLAKELQEITLIPISGLPPGRDTHVGRKKTIKNRILHSHIFRKLIKKVYIWSYLALFENNQ